jgi:prepilin-type N-terminal cleavage/methylation domain-containing protein
MKTPSHTSSSKGFTLIELLVVIAIIAVLASAGFAGGAAIMNKARKTSAQATAVSIAQAVDNFYTEYSALPDPASNSDDKDFSTDSSELLDILAGGITAKAVEQNPRKIRFLSVKEGKNNKDGAVYNGNAISKIFDPWGKPYVIWLDYNYNESIIFTPKGNNSEAKLNGRRVAVYSLGVRANETSNASTLVKTW